MKHLRSVISAYATLKKFTPGLQKIYTDISAISATFSNSVEGALKSIFLECALRSISGWFPWKAYLKVFSWNAY